MMIDANEPYGYVVGSYFFKLLSDAERHQKHYGKHPYYEVSEVEPVYKLPKPSAPAQRITEQDVRDIATIYANYLDNDDAPIADFEWYSPELQNSIRALLAELNEHREQEAGQEPYRWTFKFNNGNTANIYETYEQAFNDYEPSEGKPMPLYAAQVTANKAEVHEFATECAKSYKEHYSKWESAKDSDSKIYHEGCLRIAHHLFEVTTHLHGHCDINSLPPLKDGE